MKSNQKGLSEGRGAWSATGTGPGPLGTEGDSVFDVFSKLRKPKKIMRQLKRP